MGERRKERVSRRGERRLEWEHVRVEGGGRVEGVFSSEAIYFYYLARTKDVIGSAV